MQKIATYCPSFDLPCFFRPETKIHPLANIVNLKNLAQTLTAKDCHLDQWLEWKIEIKELINKHQEDLAGIDEFLKTITVWGLEQNPKKTMSILVDIVSLDLLTKVIISKEKDSKAPFKDIFDWAAEHEHLCREIPNLSLKTQIYSEWKKCRHFAFYLIPNLINTFLNAFNFLDSRNRYRTPFEDNLRWDNVYKILFVIPFLLIKILEPLFEVTAKVYMVSIAIIVATGILINSYHRWLRPIPDEIVNCTNLDKKMDDGLIKPKVGQEMELQRLIEVLLADDEDFRSNVLLIGDSGEGKNALVHNFIHRKHQKKLPKKLESVAIHESDCSGLTSSYTFGHSEIMNQMKDEMKGFNSRILLFFDEFYRIVLNAEAFRAFKKQFLEDEPHSKFIAAVTNKEAEEIEKLDIDGSFMRRVVKIYIKPASDEQIGNIVRDLVNRVATDIPVSDEAIEKIVEISKSNSYFPGIGRPAKAIIILMNAIGICRTSYSPYYVSNELSEARQKYQNFQLKAKQEVKVKPETLQKIREARLEMNRIQTNLKKNKTHASKIKHMIEEQQKLHADYYRLTHLLAKVSPITYQHLENESNENDDVSLNDLGLQSKSKSTISKESIGQDLQIMYLWYYFYGIETMEEKLQSEIKNIRKDMPVQVDKKLIEEVYREAQKRPNNFQNGIQKIPNHVLKDAVEENKGDINEDEEIGDEDEVIESDNSNDS